MRRAAGFSILELLIALMLGLVVIAGIVQLFVGNSRTYDLVNAQSRLQENARYAYEFITTAARNAGYFGCAPEAEYVVRGLIGNWNTIPEYNITEPVSGFEALGDGNYAPNNLITLPISSGGTDINVHKAGAGVDRDELSPESDLLIIRSVGQPVARLASTLQPDGNPQVYTPGGEPTYAVDDVMVVSDCEQGALFKVTGVTAGVDSTTLARAAGTGAFDNGDTVTTVSGDVLPATLSVLGRSYGEAATIGLLETSIFFIAPSRDLNNRDEEVNALWRKVGSNAPIELIQGVEEMQVLYGVDLSDDGVINVNRYQTIDEVADPGSIVAIQVQLAIASPDVVAELGERVTRTFTKTIGIRNVGV